MRGILIITFLMLVFFLSSCSSINDNISITNQQDNLSASVLVNNYSYQDDSVSVSVTNLDSWCAETEITGENGTILISLINGVDNLKEDFCHIHVDDNSGEISDTYFNEDGTVSIMKNYNSTGDLILKIVRDESGTYIQDESGGVTVLPP